MEQREAEAESKALSLIQEFVKKFRSIDYTLHPSDIPGEAAGKGSNMAWCARKLSEKYPLEQRRDVIVTGIDCKCNLDLACGGKRREAFSDRLCMGVPDDDWLTLIL